MEQNIGIITRSTTRSAHVPIRRAPIPSTRIQHSPILVSILSPTNQPIHPDTILRPLQLDVDASANVDVDASANVDASASASASVNANDINAVHAINAANGGDKSMFGDIGVETDALSKIRTVIVRMHAALYALNEMGENDKLYISDDKLHIEFVWNILQGFTRFVMGHGRIGLYNFISGKLKVYTEAMKALRYYDPVHSSNVFAKRELIASAKAYNNAIEEGLDRLHIIYADFSELHCVIAEFKTQSKYYLG